MLYAAELHEKISVIFSRTDPTSKTGRLRKENGNPRHSRGMLYAAELHEKISVIFSRTDPTSKTGRLRKENNNLTEIIFWGTF
jgi:hypothetical protein